MKDRRAIDLAQGAAERMGPAALAKRLGFKAEAWAA